MGCGRLALRLVPPLAQYFGLDPKQIGLDRGGATQTPQQRCQPQHQLALDRGLGVVIRNDGRLERSVVLDILDTIDDGFRAQPMPDGVASGLPFALLGSGTGASDARCVGWPQSVETRSWAGALDGIACQSAFCIVGGNKVRCGLARWVHLKRGRLPKLSCRFQRGNLQIGPPRHFVAVAVQLIMVLAAERHGEFVADLAAERAGLRQISGDGRRKDSAGRRDKAALRRRRDGPCCVDGTSLRIGETVRAVDGWPPFAGPWMSAAPFAGKSGSGNGAAPSDRPRGRPALPDRRTPRRWHRLP